MRKEKTLKNNPVGTVRYWWGWALFSRQFEMDVNVPPIRIAEHLGKVRQPMQGFPMATERSVTIRVVESERIYTFDMRIKHRSRGVNYTSVKAAGRIVYSEGYATSIIRGDVRLGWVYFAAHILSFIGVIVGLVISTLGGAPAFSVPIFAFIVLAVLYATWRIYADYIELQAMLMNQIEMAYLEQLASDQGKVSDDDNDNPVSEIYPVNRAKRS